jgi:methionine synthase II (cobalamin-independent)
MTQPQSRPADSANPGNHAGQSEHASKPGAAATAPGRERPPFRADHVGSLLRPPELQRARDDFAADRIGADDLRAIEDAAIREVVHMQLEAGLRSAKRGELESRDDLKRRIDDAARFVDGDQLCLSPQCGFSSTKEGNDLTAEQQWAKLRLIVETAQEVWSTW